MTADHDEDSSGEDGSGAGRPRRFRGLDTAMAAVLVALLVVALAVGVWSFLRLDDAEEALDARGDAARVAEQFAVSVNNYDSASVDEYKASVTDLLSTKFKKNFDQAMEDIVAQVQQAKMQSEGKVLASGVATIDDDSARVLVVADANVKTVFDERQRHFRWEVSLVKVEGEWLVDDFTPVS